MVSVGGVVDVGDALTEMEVQWIRTGRLRRTESFLE